MAIQYGVLRARPDRYKREDNASTPHLQVRALDDSGQPWRIAVNVQSDSGSNVAFWVVDPLAGQQPLVVAPQVLVVGDLPLRHEVAGVGLDAAADVALGQARRDRHAPERVVGLWLVGEYDTRRAHRELVAVGQVVIGDSLASHERPVERLEVAQQESAIRRPLDLGVLLRDDPVEDLDRVIRMTSDRVERGELELLPFLPGNDDQLCHAETLRTAPAMVRRSPAAIQGAFATTPWLDKGNGGILPRLGTRGP